MLLLGSTHPCAVLCQVASVVSMDCSRQAPLSMGFSRQEYWSGLPFPSPGDLSDPGMEPACLTSYLHWQGVLND